MRIRHSTTTKNRIELRTLIDFACRGDTIVVTKIDSLARSIADLSNLLRKLDAKDVALRAIDQPVDIGTAAGKAFLACWRCLPSSRPTYVAGGS